MIEVKNLNLIFKDKILLKNISFSLEKGKNLAIMGKSGAGKSLILKSLIKLFDKNYFLQADECQIYGKKVLELNKNDLNHLRAKVSLLFQDVYTSFYPLIDIGEYFNIVLKTHTALNSKEIKEKAFYYFECLGLKNHDLLWHSFIYQLSGGMARRIQIALALLCESRCLLCDEITSSLDAKNEEKIIAILKELKEKFSNLLFVTHDLRVARELCDEIVIVEEGKIIEQIHTDKLETAKSAYLGELLSIYKEDKCF